MTTVQISGGSEKQNAWATKIVAEWMATVNTEIANQQARPESDNMASYISRLVAARDNFAAGLPKATAKQIIDMHVAKIDPTRVLIDNARSQK